MSEHSVEPESPSIQELRSLFENSTKPSQTRLAAAVGLIERGEAISCELAFGLLIHGEGADNANALLTYFAKRGRWELLRTLILSEGAKAGLRISAARELEPSDYWRLGRSVYPLIASNANHPIGDRLEALRNLQLYHYPPAVNDLGQLVANGPPEIQPVAKETLSSICSALVRTEPLERACVIVGAAFESEDWQHLGADMPATSLTHSLYLWKQRQYDDAITDVLWSLSNQFSAGLGWSLAGHICLETGDARRALQYFEEATSTRPEVLNEVSSSRLLSPALNPLSHELLKGYTLAGRGAAKAALGFPGPAIADLTDSIRVDGGFTWSFFKRALVLKSVGHYNDSLADLNRVLELNPDHREAEMERDEIHRLQRSSAPIDDREAPPSASHDRGSVTAEHSPKDHRPVNTEEAPDALKARRDEAELTYHKYRKGEANLEMLYAALNAYIDDLEEQRLQRASQPPTSVFLGKYDVYETAAALAYALGFSGEAFEHAERARARFLLDRSLNKIEMDVRRLSDPTLLDREAALVRRLTALNRQARTPNLETVDPLAADEETIVDALRETRRQLLEIRQEIQLQDPAFAALRGMRPAALTDVQTLLRPHEALLAYCATEDRVLVFTVTQKQMWADHVNVSRSALSEFVRNYRSHIDAFARVPRDITIEPKQATQSVTPSLPVNADLVNLERQLYDLLLRTALAHLEGKSALCIIPHGDLHLIPFHALRADSEYVIETFNVWYAPSTSVLDLCYQRQRRSRGRLLAMGNPDLGDLTYALPFAEDEVMSISAMLNAESYVGPDASLDELIKRWGDCDLIHLACHASWDPHQPEFTALLLSPAGGDDGRLEVHDLFALDHDLLLSQVVLSACQTSLGLGADLIGLTTGFLYAGAPAVISSLWRVDDHSTSELMLAFYRNLLTSSRVEALRQAQSDLKRAARHSHPYHWAPFKLIGSPAPIDAEGSELSAFNLVHRNTYRSADGTLSAPALRDAILFATWAEPARPDDSDLERFTRRAALVALSVETGDLLWKRAGSLDGRASCNVPGLVHFNHDSGLIALIQSTGEVAWEHKVPGSFKQSLRYDGRLLYLGGRSRSVVAIDPVSGAIAWEQSLPRPASGGFAISRDAVFVGCNDHSVYAFRSEDGALLWRRDIGYGEWGDTLAWLDSGVLHTTAGSFDVSSGQFDASLSVEKDQAVIEKDRLIIERVARFPAGRMIEFEHTGAYHEGNIAIVVSSEGRRGNVLGFYDLASGSPLRRLSLGKEPVTGFARKDDRIVVGVGNRLIAFSIELQSTKR